MGTAKTVLIRTDGNPDIATGHLMRCLSIACALRELGAQAEFAVSGEISRRLLFSFFEEKPFPVHVLHSDFRRPESEVPSLKKLLLHGPSCLLIDSYSSRSPILRRCVP